MKRLKLWLRRRLFTYATDIEPSPAWTEADSARLRNFMRSETGLKLGIHLRSLTVRGALGAIHAQSERLAWQCGQAAGTQQAVQAIDQLAQWSPEPEEPAPGVPTDDLSWLHGLKSTDGI